MCQDKKMVPQTVSILWLPATQKALRLLSPDVGKGSHALFLETCLGF
jgi:hypothetical protein